MAEVKTSTLVKDLLTQLQLPPDDPLVPLAAEFFSPGSTQFLYPFSIGEEHLIIGGQPLVMAANSALLKELLPKLEAGGGPLVLAEKAKLTSDSLVGLLRVWLVINGMSEDYPVRVASDNPEEGWISKPVVRGKPATLTLPQLLTMWDWMNYFGVNIKSEAVRNFACNVLDTLDEIKEGRVIIYQPWYVSDVPTFLAWSAPCFVPIQ